MNPRAVLQDIVMITSDANLRVRSTIITKAHFIDIVDKNQQNKSITTIAPDNGN